MKRSRRVRADIDGKCSDRRGVDGPGAAAGLRAWERAGLWSGRQALLPPDLSRLRRRAAPAAWSRPRRPPPWWRLERSMQRIVCPERDDWRATAESAGFDFHTIDGERYWDERAYYAFTLDQIERGIEEPTAEIDAMCLELVGHAIDDENYLRRLRIPEAFWPLISESWHRDDASLYGRLDLSFDGRIRRNCWSITPTPRPRFSKPRSFSGPGSNRRSSATSSRSAPTSSIRSMNA